MIYPLLAFAITPAPPHDAGNGYTCASCHTLHKTLGATGYNNICLNCHADGDPKGGSKPFAPGDMANPFRSMTANQPPFTYQNSHNWAASDTNPAAGAAPPVQAAMTTNSLRARTGGKLACVRCHDQHSQNNPPFLRMANDRDQLCLDCHGIRNRRDHRTGTHPVNFTYTSATSKAKTQPLDYYPAPLNANPANPTSALPLKGGAVLCSTCHGVHHTDSNSATFDTFSSLPNQTQSAGFLLRTDLHGSSADAVNICSSCHKGKLAHNYRGQNVQCTDCHGGHVDVADGTQPNVWLVNRYMNFSSSVRSARNSVVIFQSDTNKNYRDAGGNGVCQACHDVPLSAGYQAFHAGTDSSTCNQCHTHGNQRGSFSVDPTASCGACHGYPPAANVSGPGGYAAGYQNTPSFTDESLSGHTSHAATPYQKACINCHSGNNHINGVYQDVFLVTAGTVAATGGLSPAYDPTAQTCTNVYCHSNANPRGGTMVTRTTPSWSNAKGGGKGAIIGQPTECGTCHSMAGDPVPSWSLSHTRHINGYGANASFTCNACHAATASGNAAIFNTATARALHTNGVKDVTFNSMSPNGTWNSAAATCTTVYCHSNVQGAAGLGAPTSFTPNLTWNGAAMNCGSCHAAMAKLNNLSAATGSHKTHVQGYSYSCAVCHGSGYSSSSVVIASHVNNVIDIAFTGTATTKGSTPGYYQGNNPPGGGYASCSNTYCHSSVQGAGGTWPPSFAAPTWGSGPLPCGSCHVNMATSAENSASGSHFLHANSQHYSCSICHNGAGKDPNPPFTATPLHGDGTIQIAFSGTAAGTSYSLGSHVAGSGYGTCSSNLCHGAMNPAWGNNTTKPRCAKCHGYRSRPWNTLNNVTSVSDTKAGTHFNHISSSGTRKYAKPFSCAECHAASIALTTDSVNAAGHFDTAAPAEVSFNILARTDALTPLYNSPTGQCSNVYCHGNSLDMPATAVLSPTWSQPFLTGVAGNDCIKCHGYPPVTGTHPSATPTTCHLCHTHVNAAGSGFTNPALHINGAIEASSGHAFPYPGATHLSAANATAPYTNCNGCHDATTAGGTYPVVPAGTPPLCSACHLNMTNFTGTAPGCWDCHGSSQTNGQPNGSSFPNIAGSHAKHAALASTPNNCAICHNGFGSGNPAHGSSNRVAATQASVHIAFNTTQAGASATWTAASSTCASTYCHSTVQGSTGTGSGTFITTPPWGSTLTCGGCHQDMSSSASATGSHISHAQSSGTVYACSVCHGTGFTSTGVVYPPHVNNVINLSFTVNAVGTSYSKGTAITPGSAAYGTCSANLCHGAMNPTWGANTSKTRCAKCHGYRTTPWNALNGATAASDSKAGAHFNHISSSGTTKFAKAFSCAECHAASIALATDNVNAAGHFDTAAPAELSFNTLAKTGALTPAYNSPTAGQCSNVYCHGSTLDRPASAVLSPTWNQALFNGIASNDCIKCHGYPPATPVHIGMTATDCTFCHPHVNADGTGFVDAAKHVNGTIDFSGTPHSFPFPGSTHNSTAGTSPFTSCVTTGCHAQGTAASPYPTTGTPPDCRSCHVKAAPIGNVNRCDSCHGTSTNGGRPTGTTFPDIAGLHGTHSSATLFTCADCHGTFGHGEPTHGSSNGQAHNDANVDVPFPAANAGFTFTRNGNGGGTCSGTCHGQGHSNFTW